MGRGDTGVGRPRRRTWLQGLYIDSSLGSGVSSFRSILLTVDFSGGVVFHEDLIWYDAEREQELDGEKGEADADEDYDKYYEE